MVNRPRHHTLRPIHQSGIAQVSVLGGSRYPTARPGKSLGQNPVRAVRLVCCAAHECHLGIGCFQVRFSRFGIGYRVHFPTHEIGAIKKAIYRHKDIATLPAQWDVSKPVRNNLFDQIVHLCQVFDSGERVGIVVKCPGDDGWMVFEFPNPIQLGFGLGVARHYPQAKLGSFVEEPGVFVPRPLDVDHCAPHLGYLLDAFQANVAGMAC